jgi:hypothetical protein
MYGSRSEIASKISHPCIYDVSFLALLGAPYIYDISRLRVNISPKHVRQRKINQYNQYTVYYVGYYTNHTSKCMVLTT